VSAGTAQRARILLLAADGESNSEISRRVGVSLPTVRAWRHRYLVGGLAGLAGRPRSGRPRSASEATVLAATLDPPPDKLAVMHWSARLLANHLGISFATVARIWWDWGLKSWKAETFQFWSGPEARRAAGGLGASQAVYPGTGSVRWELLAAAGDGAGGGSQLSGDVTKGGAAVGEPAYHLGLLGRGELDEADAVAGDRALDRDLVDFVGVGVGVGVGGLLAGAARVGVGVDVVPAERRQPALLLGVRAGRVGGGPLGGGGLRWAEPGEPVVEVPDLQVGCGGDAARGHGAGQAAGALAERLGEPGQRPAQGTQRLQPAAGAGAGDTAARGGGGVGGGEGEEALGGLAADPADRWPRSGAGAGKRPDVADRGAG